jgi:hypothetical protein
MKIEGPSSVHNRTHTSGRTSLFAQVCQSADSAVLLVLLTGENALRQLLFVLLSFGSKTYL